MSDDGLNAEGIKSSERADAPHKAGEGCKAESVQQPPGEAGRRCQEPETFVARGPLKPTTPKRMQWHKGRRNNEPALAIGPDDGTTA